MSPADLSLRDAADLLGVHYMTAYKYVRTGQLPATKAGAEWRVRTADVEALRAAPAVPRGRGGRRVDYAGRLTARLMAGDEAGAWAVIEMALSAGLEPVQVYLELLIPAMQAVGEGWATGTVTVAEEHRASVTVQRLIGRFGPRLRRRGRARGTIVLGAPASDTHSLPVALMADLVRSLGFDVVDLGADVPAVSFAEAAAEADRLVAVGIGASTPGNEAQVQAAIEAVRAVATVPVLVGGGAVAGEEAALGLGADAFVPPGAAGLAVFDALT